MRDDPRLLPLLATVLLRASCAGPQSALDPAGPSASSVHRPGMVMYVGATLVTLLVTVPMLFILGFLFIFTVGGLTGVMMASVPYDWQVHDTDFVVAHFHYVLIGLMVFPIFAALYYSMPVITGRRMSERLGRWAFALIFVGFNAAFLPMHLTGLRGMPRRGYTSDGALGLNWPNLISTVAAFVLAARVLVFLIDFIRHLRRGTRRGATRGTRRRSNGSRRTRRWASAACPSSTPATRCGTTKT